MSGLETLVFQITAFNHAWKLSKERWPDKSYLVNSLRDRKSCLQVRLLREFPTTTYLHLDLENDEGEPLFSVRLNKPIKLSNGFERRDAEHMPVRLAEDFFAEDELLRMVK